MTDTVPITQPALGAHSGIYRGPVVTGFAAHNYLAPGVERFAWVVAVLLALLHAWMLHRYAVNFPTADDFTQILVVPTDVAQLPTLREKLAYLLAPAIEHRITVIRLVAYVQANYLGGIDFRKLIYLGNLMCAGTGLLVAWQAPREWRGWVAVIVALLLFSPANWHAQYWPTAAIQHLAIVTYALGALYCAQRSGIRWTSAAVLLALLAAGTAANGLTVFLAAAVQMAFARRRQAALGWVVSGFAFALVYFIHSDAPAADGAVSMLLQQPLQLVTWFLAAVGSFAKPFSMGYGAPAMAGAMVLVAWAWLFAGYRAHPVRPLFVGWMIFLLATAASITVGRGPYGVDTLLTSRYRVYSELTVLVTVIACLWRLRVVGSQRLQLGTLTAMVLLAAAWAWINWGANVDAVVDYANGRRNGLDHYAATRGHGLYGPFPTQAFGDAALKKAIDAGIYRGVGDAPLPAVPIATAHTNPAVAAQFLDPAPVSLGGGALSVSGRTRGPQADVVLWLALEGQNYKGKLRLERVFEPSSMSYSIGFWNTFTLTGMPPGRYHVGYTVTDSPDAAVYWTGEVINVP